MDAKQFKQQLLFELYEPYRNCTKCPLGSLGRKHVVFGEGNPDAELMFVGEGPGADEDAQGRPFVGRSGKLLNRCLQKFNIEREAVFITNIVKCRPPQNRTPSTLEIDTCKNLLLIKQIKIIRPKVICTLGGAAFKGLIEKDIKISKMRGSTLAWKENKDITIIPIYHPAYILRNPSAIDDFMDDLSLVVNTLNS